MRIVFELKRGEQAEVVLNNLYKHTQLQTGFGIIMLSIVNGQPRELGLIEIIKYFIDHRVEVVRRRTEYELRKAREREHLLLGFQKALDNLDEVIRLIRAAARAAGSARIADRAVSSSARSRRRPSSSCSCSGSPGWSSRRSWTNWPKSSGASPNTWKSSGSDKVLRDVIVKELKEVQKEFGDERRTQIIEDTGEIRLEDLVAVEDVAITVTRGGYLKRTSVDTYRRQTRGGKGRIGMGTRAEDVVEHLIVASTHSYLLIFTTRGRVYWLKAYEIPDAATTGKGKHISNLINLQSGRAVQAFLSVKDFVPDQLRGDGDQARRHQEIRADRVRQPHVARHHRGDAGRGRRADRRQDHQRRQLHLPGLARRPGHPLRREARCGPWAGRRAASAPWTWREGDYLVGMEVVEKEGLILSIAENGFGKRTPLENYRLTDARRQGRHQHEDHPARPATWWRFFR